MDVAIIGAGIAGLAAADEVQRLGRNATIYEAAPHRGGHTSSVEFDGFVFDEGPHVSFTKNSAVADLFTANARQVEEFKAQITNWYRGHWLTHPAQCHLFGLEPELIAACIEDLVASRESPVTQPANYAEWCIDGLGRTFAEEFTFRYTRKYWTVDAAEMSTEWVADRMYPPTIKDVLLGALRPQHAGDFHYLSSFRYPSTGGFQTFLRGMGSAAALHLGKRVSQIDVQQRALTFEDGTTAEYESLISTMPLPTMIAAVAPGQCPAEVRAAAARLRCTSVLLVDVAVDRADLSQHHWFYVYDEDLLISRGHFPHMLAPANAPAGCGSVQLEVYFTEEKPLPDRPEVVVERVVDELVLLGVLRHAGEARWVRHRVVPFANVLFDHQRADALAAISPWLRQSGIKTAGRYGEWGYLWTDDAIVSGWRAASELTT